MTTVAVDARITSMPGIGRFAIELLTALTARPSPDVHVVPVLGPARSELDERVPGALRSASVNLPTRPFVPQEQWTVPRLLRAHDASLVHSLHFNVPYRAKVPLMLTVYDLFPIHEPRIARSWLTRTYYGQMMPRGIKRADLLVCISDYTARDVKETFGFSDSHVRVVPLGLDHAMFYPPTQDQITDVRRRYGLPQEHLLAVGTAKFQKNLPLLCRAWNPSLPPLVFVGCDETELREQVKGDVPLSTRFLGRVPDRDLALLYGSATAVAVPSLYEGVGLAVLEAMACGTPVVASSGPGVSETAQGAALSVSPHDVDAWTAALSRVCDDADLRTDLRSAGLAVAAARTWSTSAAGYMSLYRELT